MPLKRRRPWAGGSDSPGEAFTSFRVFELLHDSTTASAAGWRCAGPIARWRRGCRKPNPDACAERPAGVGQGAIDQCASLDLKW